MPLARMHTHETLIGIGVMQLHWSHLPRRKLRAVERLELIVLRSEFFHAIELQQRATSGATVITIRLRTEGR